MKENCIILFKQKGTQEIDMFKLGIFLLKCSHLRTNTPGTSLELYKKVSDVNFIYKALSARDYKYKKTNAYKSVHRFIIPLPTDHKEHNIFDILYV